MAENKHDKARDLADKGLEEMVEGHEKEGRQLIEEAKKIDPKAAKEAAQGAEEEAKQAEQYIKEHPPGKREGA